MFVGIGLVSLNTGCLNSLQGLSARYLFIFLCSNVLHRLPQDKLDVVFNSWLNKDGNSEELWQMKRCSALQTLLCTHQQEQEDFSTDSEDLSRCAVST